jgi:hypothetical protein
VTTLLSNASLKTSRFVFIPVDAQTVNNPDMVWVLATQGEVDPHSPFGSEGLGSGEPTCPIERAQERVLLWRFRIIKATQGDKCFVGAWMPGENQISRAAALQIICEAVEGVAERPDPKQPLLYFEDTEADETAATLLDDLDSLKVNDLLQPGIFDPRDPETGEVRRNCSLGLQRLPLCEIIERAVNGRNPLWLIKTAMFFAYWRDEIIGAIESHRLFTEKRGRRSTDSQGRAIPDDQGWARQPTLVKARHILDDPRFIEDHDEWKAAYERDNVAATSQTISNFAKRGRSIEPLQIDSIVESTLAATGNWPGRLGRLLFSPRAASTGVDWHENPASLFGWLGSAARQSPNFKGGPGFHTKSEVFERLRHVAPDFVGVETYPHEPRMAGAYYACKDYPAGDGTRLTELVGMFSPETDIDRDLILAFFVTVFWGEHGATRPMFAITSNEGRGVGKTTLVEMVGYLVGGNFAFSLGENIEVVKQRLLSSEYLTTRVALIDNAKTSRVSHADFEALITCRTISGKKLYVGEASRPNNLVWAITLNGASFSTDVAQRAVVIKLRRPTYSGTWEDHVRRFIDKHRDELISDCIGFLRREPAQITEPDRWGPWCCQIVARLPEPNDAIKVISERRAATDTERSEVEEVEEEFSKRLVKTLYEPDRDRVFIPSKIACHWCRDARNEPRESNNATGRWLSQQVTEGATKCLTVSQGRANGRGYIWTGQQWNGQDPMKVDLESQIAAHADRLNDLRKLW